MAPIYDYRCPKCEREFDRVKSITDDTPEFCYECAGDPVTAERLISRGTGVIFRGAGWTPKFHSS